MNCFAKEASTPPQEFKLNNGLKLIVQEDHRAPVVVNMVWYKAGSVDEVSSKTGVAHALEHMMFKSTKKLKVGEFSTLIAKMGGEENAFTTNDYTAYYQRIDSQFLPKILALEADRMANLTLSETEFSKEIRVIMEERRWRTEDKPQAKAYEALMAAAFQASPIRTPVIGWMNDLEHMTYKDAQAWYQTWYTPNNATIIIVGDVDTQKTYHLVNQLFGKLTPKPLPTRLEQLEPPQTGMRTIRTQGLTEHPFIMLGYKTPRLESNKNNKDVYALAVLSNLLTGDDSSLLIQQLTRVKPLALSIESSYDLNSRYPSLFTIYAMLSSTSDTTTLQTSIESQLADILKNGVSKSVLDRIKLQWLADHTYKKDSMFQQALDIGQLEMSGIPYSFQHKITEGIQAVSSEDIQRVIAQYLRQDQLTVSILDPISPQIETPKK